MNSSLRDQLLAAGLVTEKQARKAAQEEQQRHYRKHASPPQARPQQERSQQARPQQQPPSPSPQVQAQQAQAAKVARDKELNRRREDKAQRRARMAEIERLVEQNRLPRLETEDYYSFTDGRKIRRMSVDAQRREQLTKGELLVVRYKGFYAVVPAAIAERIRERDANMVVPVVKSQPSSAADEDYKDFVVPDDLMW